MDRIGTDLYKGDRLKKLAFLGGAAGLGILALLGSPLSQAADHLDSAALTNPMADVNDLYAWMQPDGASINLALTVSPFDDGSNSFDASVQYVFHLTRHEGFPATATAIMAGEESKIICTFTSNTDGQCWVVNPSNKVVDYVAGDFSVATGKASEGGGLRVFAGPRSDPFFFNLAGFLTAQKTVQFACGGNTMAGTCPGTLETIPCVNDAGCPDLTGAQTVPIATDLATPQAGPTQDPLSTLGPCEANQIDCFEGKNVMALVVQVDKSLITTDSKQLLSVWASTHAGQ